MENEYERRLQQCMTCPALMNETTCRHCGCLVRYRAALKAKACPAPGESRWSKS